MKYLTLPLFFLSVHSVFAAPWVSNLDHSEIHFKVPYMKVSEVSGRFDDFNAEIERDEKGEFTGPVTVRIDVNSIDTGNKMRDGHLKSFDFFNAQQHPEILFEGQKVFKQSANSYKAVGDLTIKGIKRTASVIFTTTESTKDTWGHDSIFVKFSATVNRKDYNINWNKTLDGQEFLVGDEVAYNGTFQMQPKRDKTPNSKHMIPDNPFIRKRDEERQKSESGFSRKFRNLINGRSLND